MLQAKLTQSAGVPTTAAVDRLRAWVLVTPAVLALQARARIPYGELIYRRRRRAPRGEEGDTDTPVHVTDLPNGHATRAVHAGVPAGMPAFELLTLARRLVQPALDIQPAELSVSLCGFTAAEGERVAEAIISAALARAVELPIYKSKRKAARPLRRIRISGFAAAHGFERSVAEAAGNGLARYLTALPPNELTPGQYRQRLEVLARERNWEFEFLDVAALKKRGAGAFLAVVQGSSARDAGIARLSYRPARAATGRRLALVGKGVCFDTGGVNLKSSKHMLGMHEDMAGSAVALGTLLALSALGVGFDIDCWLALAVNHVSDTAYQPNDVVTALDGSTIEVIHTDAEGRMILADTLALASQTRPALIIDYATLTGACVDALGKAYSGVFTNRDAWNAMLIDSGRESGERVWPFPQDKDYDHALDSTVADIKQCTAEGEADHILAARFLSRFVTPDTAWVHLDLSAANHKGGLAHVPSDVTGFGVRYTCNLVLDRQALARP